MVWDPVSIARAVTANAMSGSPGVGSDVNQLMAMAGLDQRAATVHHAYKTSSTGSKYQTAPPARTDLAGDLSTMTLFALPPPSRPISRHARHTSLADEGDSTTELSDANTTGTGGEQNTHSLPLMNRPRTSVENKGSGNDPTAITRAKQHPATDQHAPQASSTTNPTQKAPTRDAIIPWDPNAPRPQPRRWWADDVADGAGLEYDHANWRRGEKKPYRPRSKDNQGNDGDGARARSFTPEQRNRRNFMRRRRRAITRQIRTEEAEGGTGADVGEEPSTDSGASNVFVTEIPNQKLEVGAVGYKLRGEREGSHSGRYANIQPANLPNANEAGGADDDHTLRSTTRDSQGSEVGVARVYTPTQEQRDRWKYKRRRRKAVSQGWAPDGSEADEWAARGVTWAGRAENRRIAKEKAKWKALDGGEAGQ